MTTTKTVFANKYYCVEAVLHHPSHGTDQYDLDQRKTHTELKLFEIYSDNTKHLIDSLRIRNKVEKRSGLLEKIFNLEIESYTQLSDDCYQEQFDQKADELIAKAQQLTKEHVKRLKAFTAVVGMVTSRYESSRPKQLQGTAA